MNDKVSKANVDMDFFHRRIDEIRMSGHERLRAKARFAQAEAMAEALATVGRGIARLFRPAAAKTGGPAGRSAASAG